MNAPAHSVPQRTDGVLYTRAAVDPATLSAADRTVDVIASTEDIDGHGTVIRQNWRLERFRANPVVLYSHNAWDLPIGTADNVRIEDGQLRARLKFSTAELNPEAEKVWLNVQAKVLRGISVGFMPHSVKCEMEDDREYYVLDDNELYEISVTPVPSNAATLAQMRARAIGRPERGAVPFKALHPVEKGSWDAKAAVTRVREWASSDGSGDTDKLDWSKYRQAFAWYDASNPETLNAYKLPHHDVLNGELVTMKAGVEAAGNVMQGGRGGASIPDGDVDAVKAHLAKHYHQFDITAPWESENKQAPPAQETSIMADQNNATPTVARALGLPAGSSESDMLNAATRLRELEVQVIAVTGVQTSAEAAGAVRGLKAKADEADKLKSEVETLRGERDKQNFEAQLQRGINERKLSPETARLEREKFERRMAEGRGAEAVADLKGFVDVAPTLYTPRAVQPGPAGAPTGAALSWNGASYRDLKPMQRAALKRENPELYRLMKDEWEAAGRPAAQSAA